MENWLPFSMKPPAKVMSNYNPLHGATEGFYAVGGDVKVKNVPMSKYPEGHPVHAHPNLYGRPLQSQNPLVRAGFVDYPRAYEALWYGWGKGVKNKPLTNVAIHNGRSYEQVEDLDSSNYYNFVK
jgi:hypothetical protein